MTDSNLAKLIDDIKNVGPLIEAATTKLLDQGEIDSGVQLIALKEAAEEMINEHIIGPDCNAWVYNNEDVRHFLTTTKHKRKTQ